MLKRNSHRHNIQMYFCRDCDRQFQNGRRIDNVCLWNDCLTRKRTISDLPILHKSSERTIRRRLVQWQKSFHPSRICNYNNGYDLLSNLLFTDIYNLACKTVPIMENNGSFFKNVPCFLQECTLLLKKSI